MDRLYADIGGRMRSLRKSLGLTQAQVAEKAGIDSSFYGQVERGANIPSLKTLMAIARTLGVGAADILPNPSGEDRSGYRKIIERLISDLPEKNQHLVLGMVSDFVQRLKH